MPYIVNSKFTPLTYNDISTPLLQATQAQEQVEEAYAETMQQASEVKAQLNEARDTQSYNTLKAYYEDLKAQADDIATNGLRPGSRRALMTLKGRYGEDVTPIQQAALKREKALEEQRQYQLAHPDTIMQNDLSLSSVDSFVKDPSFSYGHSVDGNSLMVQAQAIVKAFGQAKNEINIPGNIDKWNKKLVQMTGFTPEQIAAALDPNNKDADIYLKVALQNLYDSSGIEQWGDDVSKAKVKDYIYRGAMLGQGEVNATITPDKDYERAVENADFRSRYDYQHSSEISDATVVDTDGNTWTEAKNLTTPEGVGIWIQYDDKGNVIKYGVRGPKTSKGTTFKEISSDRISKKTSSSSSSLKENEYLYDNKKYLIINNKGTSIKYNGEQSFDEVIIQDENGKIITDENLKKAILNDKGVVTKKNKKIVTGPGSEGSSEKTGKRLPA